MSNEQSGQRPQAPVTVPLPPMRGPAYDRRLQFFLKHGEIDRMHSRFIVIKRATHSREVYGYEYGLCCFGCGNISWKQQEVIDRYCPSCGVILDK